jgi:hypothetical protein
MKVSQSRKNNSTTDDEGDMFDFGNENGRNSSSNGVSRETTASSVSSDRSVSLNELDGVSNQTVEEILLKKFKELHTKESKEIINFIEQTREAIQNSTTDFYGKQSVYKKNLQKITEENYGLVRRKGERTNNFALEVSRISFKKLCFFLENSVPLAEYLKKKKSDTPVSISPEISNGIVKFYFVCWCCVVTF